MSYLVNKVTFGTKWGPKLKIKNVKNISNFFFQQNDQWKDVLYIKNLFFTLHLFQWGVQQFYKKIGLRQNTVQTCIILH